jgi:hypothetical protein
MTQSFLFLQIAYHVMAVTFSGLCLIPSKDTETRVPLGTMVLALLGIVIMNMGMAQKGE